MKSIDFDLAPRRVNPFSSMTPFTQATYLSQVKRLRRLAETALARYDLKKPEIHFINHGENTTFRIETKGGNRFLLRVHRDKYHSEAAIKEELAWLKRLGAAGRTLVPVPIKSRNGRLLESVESSGLEGPRYCDLLQWVDGRFIEKSVSTKHLFDLGRLMAKLHQSTDGTKVLHRRYWDASGLVGPKPKFGSIERICELNKNQQKILSEGRMAVFTRLKKFQSRFPDRMGLIHADLHFGNFVVGKEGLGAIDFDDCGFGFHAYDLVIPLTQIAHLCKDSPKKKFLHFVESIQNGYASLGHWDHHDEAILPVLFAARRLTMVGWLNSRSDNPRLKKLVPGSAKRAIALLKTNWEKFS